MEQKEPDWAKVERSALGHVANFEKLALEWADRRDKGDCVPDAATLTRWVAYAEGEAEGWRKQAATAASMQAPVKPLG